MPRLLAKRFVRFVTLSLLFRLPNETRSFVTNDPTEEPPFISGHSRGLEAPAGPSLDD
jgi:hypothetical protein